MILSVGVATLDLNLAKVYLILNNIIMLTLG